MIRPSTEAALEAAIVGAACAVLARRATRLRSDAAQLETTVVDGRGHVVLVSSPEAVVKRQTAALLDDIASDLREGRPCPS